MSKEAYVSLVDSDDVKQLWPNYEIEKDTQLSITMDKGRKALKVALIALQEGGTSGRETERMIPGKTDEFTCKDEDGLVGKSSEGTIYQGLMKKDPLSTERKTESMPLKVSVSLSDCKFSGDKKQAECSLKVVIKVTQKTR